MGWWGFSIPKQNFSFSLPWCLVHMCAISGSIPDLIANYEPVLVDFESWLPRAHIAELASQPDSALLFSWINNENPWFPFSFARQLSFGLFVTYRKNILWRNELFCGREFFLSDNARAMGAGNKGIYFATSLECVCTVYTTLNLIKSFAHTQFGHNGFFHAGTRRYSSSL
jgi:hypothetical protein